MIIAYALNKVAPRGATNPTVLAKTNPRARFDTRIDSKISIIGCAKTSLALPRSEFILALADFGKHLPGRLARQANEFCHFGKIGAQEWIRGLLLTHQGWDCHRLGGHEFCYFLVALQ